MHIQTQERVRLAEARTAANVSQRALAKRAEKNRLTLRRAEAGRPIKISTAQDILGTLNEIRRERGLTPLGLDDVNWGAEEEK